jgi:hypothetical protein
MNCAVLVDALVEVSRESPDRFLLFFSLSLQNKTEYEHEICDANVP